MGSKNYTPKSGSKQLEAVRSLIEIQRLKSYMMPPGWFSDPAWDILLVLYESHLTNDVNSFEDLCRNGSVSVIRRWCDVLLSSGVVVRAEENLLLSSSGVEVMSACFAGLAMHPLFRSEHGDESGDGCTGL